MNAMAGTSTEAAGWKAPRIVVWSTVAFAVSLLVVVAGLGEGFLYPYLQPIRHVPGGDKTLHFLLLGSLALLLNVTWGGVRSEWGPFVFLRGSAVTTVVATLEEFSQHFIALRAFSVDDLLYDYLGIVVLGQLGGAIGWWLRRRTGGVPEERPEAPHDASRR